MQTPYRCKMQAYYLISDRSSNPGVGLTLGLPPQGLLVVRPMMALKPPFESDFASHAIVSNEFSDLLPASTRCPDTHDQCCPSFNVSQFVARDLCVKRLNDVQEWLWIAGRALPPRPLTFQIAVGRTIVPDQRGEMHVVWEGTRRMHIKPLPRYLLASQFWRDHICPHAHVYSDAVGFLYSYLALIQYESDFAIAKSHNLVSESLDWTSWVLLTQQVLTAGTSNCSSLATTRLGPELKRSPRYTYGELRLSRLNLLYRLRYGCLIRGYEYRYQTYGELLTAYIAPLSITTVYIALALTAMQTGLATDFLEHSAAFRAVSGWFAVASIVVPLAVILGLGVVATVVFVINLCKALAWKQDRQRKLCEAANLTA